MPLDLDWLSGGLPLAPHRLVIADQLLLFAVDADHRLAGGQRRLDRLVDVLELLIAVGMLGSLTRLLVGLKPEPLPLEQLSERALGDLMTHPHQRLAKLGQARGRPPQRRLGIPSRRGIDQPIQIPDHRRVDLNDRPAPTTSSPHLATLQALAALKLGQPATDCLLGKARATSATPPGPCVLASLAAQIRRLRSSHSGPNNRQRSAIFVSATRSSTPL